MVLAYTLLLATLMPSFAFYEAVRTSSEYQTLKEETMKINATVIRQSSSMCQVVIQVLYEMNALF